METAAHREYSRIFENLLRRGRGSLYKNSCDELSTSPVVPCSQRYGSHFLPTQPKFVRRGLFDNILDNFDRIESAIVPMLAAVSHQREESAGKQAKITDDDSKLAISLNVANFKPEKLSVDLDGRNLKVQGKQEIKEQNGYSMRTFVRQWMLPNDVDVEQLKSSLTEDGHLALEAPKITKKSPTTRSIRIEKAPLP